MKLTSRELLELLKTVRELGYRRFHLEDDGLILDVDADARCEEAPTMNPAPVAETRTAVPIGPAMPAPVPSPPATGAVAEPVSREGLVAVRAPMTGTFYAAPEPGNPPFVTVGQRVVATDIVCIIEVMKLFNSVPAGTDGEVVEIARSNEDPVKAGEPVIWIRPQ